MTNQKPAKKTIDDTTECAHDFVVGVKKYVEKGDDGNIYEWNLCTDCNHPIRNLFSHYEITQWIYSGEENKLLRGVAIKGRIGRGENTKYDDQGHPSPRPEYRESGL